MGLVVEKDGTAKLETLLGHGRLRGHGIFRGVWQM